MADDAYLEMAMHMRGLQVAQMIHVAAELGVADKIGEGRAVAELATEVDAHPEKLSRMIRALAAFGIFAIDAAGRVTHTPRSAVLKSDATPTLHFASRFWGRPWMWETWGNIGHTVRTGEAAFEKAFGMPNFTWLKDHPDDAAVFDAFMQHSPDDRHAAVAEAYDFGKTKVVDIGGGNGALLAAILGRYPESSGVLADQPAVVAAANSILGPLAGRCEVVPTDFFSGVPAGGDIYTMAQILHDWSDERCIDILKNVRLAMGGNSKLIVIERLMDDDPAKNSRLNVLGDMQMMALFPGAKERTPSEFAALFSQVGLRAPKLTPTRSPFFLIETQPA